MIETIITSAIISSRILTIYDQRLDRYVRPTLNVFIKKPYGYGFSTQMRQLEEKGYVNYVNDFSVPGLVGSVRGGKIYVGSLAHSGFKLTVFDEVMQLDRKSKKVILELTEHGTASRDLQYFTDKRIEKNVTGGKYVAQEGKLTLYVHTSFIFGTASDDIYNDPDLKMLLTRCFCINLTMDSEEAIRLKKEGRKLIIREDIIPKEPIEKVVLPEDINDYLLNEMLKDMRVDESEGGYYTRCHDDMIRLSAVHCVTRSDVEINKKDVKFALKLYPLHQLGYLGVQLSDTSLRILNICNNKTIDEIASKLNLHKSTIYRHMQKLIECGLISKIGNKYVRTF